MALSKIKAEETRQAWEAIKQGSPKKLMLKSGTTFSIGLDGKVHNRTGSLVGSLLLDGTLLQNDQKPFPKGLVLVSGSNEKIIGKVEDNQLKVLRKSSIEKTFKILDTLKTPGADNKAVFTADAKTFIGALTPEGTIVSKSKETIAQLQLDGTFITPDSKPFSQKAIIVNPDKTLVAKTDENGAVELYEKPVKVAGADGKEIQDPE